MQLILSYIANSKHIGFCIGKRARDLFNALDEDGNGFLTEEEFIQGKKNTVNTVFKDHWLNLKKHEVPAGHKEAGGGGQNPPTATSVGFTVSGAVTPFFC